ncbi:MAG: CvpA family protein, partial [Isosphaeraceae bacterium]
ALSMLVVYAIVSGGVFLAAWVVRSTLRRMKFEAFDRHLGMVLGGLEGSLIGVVGTLFVVSLAPQTRAPIFDSPTGRVVGHLMNAVGPVLPTEVRQAIAPSWDHEAEAVATRPESRDQGQGLGPAEWKKRWKDQPTAPNPDDATVPKMAQSTRNDAQADLDTSDDLAAKVRGRVGRAAGDFLNRELKANGLGQVDADGQVRDRVGRAAGDVLERKLTGASTDQGNADVVGDLTSEIRGQIGRTASGSIDQKLKANGLGQVDPDGQVRDRVGRMAGDFLERKLTDSNVDQTGGEAAGDLTSEIRGQIGRAAGGVLEQRIKGSDLGQVDANGQIRARVGRAAAGALERGIKKGNVPDLNALYQDGRTRLYQEGRTRLGQAAAEVLEQELQKVGNADGQDRNPGR